MSFDAKFFFVAIVLSIVAGLSQYITQWLLLVYRLSPLFFSSLVVGLAPVRLAFGVVVPFVVMYFLGKNVDSPSAFKPIIISIFLGSWIGQVSVFLAGIFVNLTHGAYYSFAVIAVFHVAWEIIAGALSGVFFASLAAVLFAHYQKTAKETHANILQKPMNKLDNKNFKSQW